MALPDGTHWMGPGTLRIDRRLFHGPIRAAVGCRLKQQLPEDRHGIVLLQGGSIQPFYCTDGEYLFRQDPYMHYMFGVSEDDVWGALDVRTGRTYLFVPRLDPSYAVWLGPLHGLDWYKAKYSVDEVAHTADMAAVLAAAAPPCLHLLSGTDTDSNLTIRPPSFDGCERFELETQALFGAITESRVFKTPGEIALLQYVNNIGSMGHVAMMQALKPGTMEYQLEALFQHTTYSRGGCRFQGYTCIAASGPNAAVLHYGHAGAPNDRQVTPADLMLADMGCEYYRVGSDITTTWPACGKFSEQQAMLYNAVLAAHDAVLDAMGPGVAWPDMQTLAYEHILGGLAAGGLLGGGSVAEMIAADIGGLFMPHGLGHFLGIATHDCGGYGPGCPPRSTRPGYSKLRTARVLQPGMVITVEPGCYFNPALLEPAFKDPRQAKFLNRDALARFAGCGGVRIESNVVITPHGRHNLTHVPRTIQEVEAVCAGGAWPVTAVAAAPGVGVA